MWIQVSPLAESSAIRGSVRSTRGPVSPRARPRLMRGRVGRAIRPQGVVELHLRSTRFYSEPLVVPAKTPVESRFLPLFEEYTQPREGLRQLWRGKPGPFPSVRVLWDAFRSPRGAPRRAKDGHRRVLGPCRLDQPRRVDGLGVSA